MIAASLSAYSCGGSHGFGAFWLHLTVFPFDPVIAVRGNHHAYLWITERKLSIQSAKGDPGPAIFLEENGPEN